MGTLIVSPHQSYRCGYQSVVEKSQLAPPIQFDAVTKYALPANRTPNAITVAPDGSVWFGELGVPGIAHLYTNGTLVEYRWPFSYAPSVPCSDLSNTWGIAVWDGRVWGSSMDPGSIVGLSPSNDTFQTIQLKNGSNPYTLAVGPDNDLWFTQLSHPAQIGKIAPVSHSVTYYPLPDGANSSSAYLAFENSTLAYALSLDVATASGNVYSFNPSSPSPSFQQVGSAAGVGKGPTTPTSLALGEGGIWVPEHATSDMDFFDTSTMQWQTYPTSTVGYISFTLPYFDVSNGSAVWFTEHFANKLGEICCNRTALTEYSYSDPAAQNLSSIDNTLSVALGQNRVWFTEETADYVGYVDTSYSPPFSVSLAGNSSVTVAPGSSAQVQVEVAGQSPKPLTFQFSDSERSTAIPENITFAASQPTLPSLNGNQAVTITVDSAKETLPGQYTALVTVTDGLIFRSVYLEITVSG